MAFNSNFDILEAEAWNALLLANNFPMRPALANANTSIAGVNIEGQVAAKNTVVKIPRAVKPTDDAKVYAGSGYTPDTPDFTQPELRMEDVLYRNFFVDKWDARSSLPDLISSQVLPRMHNILDLINKSYVKRELNRFKAATVDLNTNPTKMSESDLRQIRKILLGRHFVEDKTLAAVIDPNAQFDLTGESLFQEADKRGNNDIQLRGAMANAFGFDFMLDNLGAAVDSSSKDGDATVADAVAVGDLTVTIDDGSGGASDTTLANGDVIYFGTASDPDDWYVVESVNAAKTEITLKEPLRAIVADNAGVTGVSGFAQYFYDPDALALITAIPEASQVRDASGVTRIPFFEPTNRVNFLISLEGKTAGVDVTIETLVGAKNFYEDRGGRVISGTAAKA